MMKKTLENGVVYVPGEAFYHDKPDTRTCVFLTPRCQKPDC